MPDHTGVCRRAETSDTSKLKNIGDDEHIHFIIDSTGLKFFGYVNDKKTWTQKKTPVMDRNSQAIVTQELSIYHECDDSHVVRKS